jgi:hypothetical protein
VLNALTILSGVTDPLGHKEAGIDAKAVCPLSLLPLLLLRLPWWLLLLWLLTTRVNPVGPVLCCGSPAGPWQLLLLLTIAFLVVVEVLCVPLTGSVLILSVLAWLRAVLSACRLLTAAAFSEPKAPQHGCCLASKLETCAVSEIRCCFGLSNVLLLSGEALPAFEAADGPTMAPWQTVPPFKGLLVLLKILVRVYARAPASNSASAAYAPALKQQFPIAAAAGQTNSSITKITIESKPSDTRYSPKLPASCRGASLLPSTWR